MPTETVNDAGTGARLLAARGWSRHGQSVMRTREGVPELIGLYLAEWRSEQWIGPDGEPALERGVRPTGRRWWLIGPSPDLPDTVRGGAAQSASPRTEAPLTAPALRGRSGSWENPDREFLAALPLADPHQLLAVLLAAHPPTRFLGPLDRVAAVLACGRYPEVAVAALVEALADDETITVLDDVADLWGRPCRALRHERDGMFHDLLVDPSASSYRGRRELTGPDPAMPVPPGTLTGGDVLVTRDHLDAGHTPAELEPGADPVLGA